LKILIAGYFSAFWHERAWCRALRELGHEVIEFQMQPYIPSNIVGRVQNRFVFGPAINRINHEMIQAVGNAQPDVVVCYRALPLKAETIAKIRQNHSNQTVVICYNNDNAFGEVGDKAYWRHFKQAIPCYDLHLAYRESDVSNLGSNIRAYVLHPHYLPWLHRTIPPEQLADWSSDICFLGHFEPDRRQQELDYLMANVSAHYRLHGSAWAEHSKGMAWHGMDTRELQGESYVKALNASKIALVFFSTWNHDKFTRRVFEIPVCGTLMLSQRTDLMKTLYEEDKEAVYFDSKEELVDKASYYLAHDDARNKIIESALKRCIGSGYDIYSRMREWLAVVEAMRVNQ
jgi:spore maturation protein CgeB